MLPFSGPSTGIRNGGVLLTGPSADGVLGQVLRRSTTSKRFEFGDPESPGLKLRRLSKQAEKSNPYLLPYMQAVSPWIPGEQVYQSNCRVHGGNVFVAYTNGITTTQSKWAISTAYTVGNKVVNPNNGNVYTCTTAGTSASSGTGPSGTGTGITDNGAVWSYSQTYGPTGLQPAGSTDGTAGWIFFCVNTVTSDPSSSYATYAANTAYSVVGAIVNNGGRLYTLITTGTTASSGGGPTSSSNYILDGTAVWSFYGVYKSPPSYPDWPTFTSNTSLPGGLTNNYGVNTWPNIGVLGVKTITAGSGYAAGEIITMSGGTFSTAARFLVNTVDGTGAITSLSVYTAGSYTVLPLTTTNVQGSTTGSGTGATFALRWPTPSWCALRGGYFTGLNSGGQMAVATFTGTPNSTPIQQHTSIEFYSDAPIIAFTCSTTAAFFNVVIDGQRWNLGGLPNSTSTAYYQTFDFSLTGGRKVRHYRLEARAASNLSGVRVDTSSSVWAPPDADKTTAVYISDSILQGAAYGPHIPGGAISQRLGTLLGINDFWNFSIGGTGWINQGAGAGTTTNSFDTRIAEAVALNPDGIFFMGSTNDGGQAISTFTAKVLSVLQSTRATGWGGFIVVFGLLSVDDTAYTSGKKIADYENALLAAVTSFNDPKCYYIPIRNDASGLPWITVSTVNNSANTNCYNSGIYINASDKIHPCDAGHQYIANRQAHAFRTLVLPYIK